MRSSSGRNRRGEEDVDPTTAWAQAAVRGDFVVGDLVRYAAERHLRDLRDGERRGLYFRPDIAQRAFDFFPAMFTITDGPAAGKPFNLLPWQTFAVGSLMGWHNADGRLRFRSAWIETGKGQAKSPLMAGLGLYSMGWCDAPRAQVYAIAADKNTANVLFKDAVAMCRAQIPGWDDGDTLEEVGEVVIRGEGDNAWKIEHPASQSFFRALAGGETQSGPRPRMVLADEIHEFKTDGQIETWRRAIAKIAGSAMMVLGTNTPATSQHVGTSYSDSYQDIARGKVRDDSAFSLVFRVDKSDWKTIFENEAVWQKSLPALGITYPVTNIREEVQTAKTRLSTASSVKRLYFGIPTGAADFWIDEVAWAAVLDDVNSDVLAALKGCPCWLTLDLSQKNDLTALTATWIDGAGIMWQKSWYWTTKDGLADRAVADQAPYEQWVEDGWLNAVPGATIDFEYVAEQVQRLCGEHNVVELAFDPAKIADFETACDKIGFPVWTYKGPKEKAGNGLRMVKHFQGPRVNFEDRQYCMPKSIQRFEDRILAKTIVIDNSPVTYSCAANAALLSDPQGNRAFDKKRSRGRIDGIVTSAMGAGAADNVELAEGGYSGSLFVDI
ncbi:Phage terminase-like protein, large subunit, contains N-terminal HTH domain [Sphingomonas laterariae]|uniref:Phage terminase-like protein, large subunit, contains N-terminal HTH domain n=1 Tax=Edaphosphingomonas laterariae TaxID=861865 RepID=A0A239JK17_9SPHN|nr:terminase TerL endonuclease subunit [Sphingomonas laterariae]SNT05922.1 Phage terminase-like protein, large subunit, contains N-terminal HTH domain [Sphingomonas laterariae]